MTALVGILNKRGAAIAADSAMTVFGNDSSKIYNNEQKIFPFSNKNPIRVMVCNNLNFLTTPWALIFELYKAERGNKKFLSLTGYVEDFMEFLSSLKNLQTQEEKTGIIVKISKLFSMPSVPFTTTGLMKNWIRN